MPLFQNGELLPKSQVFHEQVVARAKDANSQCKKKPQQARREISFQSDPKRLMLSSATPNTDKRRSTGSTGESQ
jgi:hypothetical protein